MGERQAHGIIEHTLGLVARQAALEHRIGVKIPPDARILYWLAEFAAYLMDRCDISSDGETPRTDPGTRRQGLVHARQASEKKKVGTAVLSWHTC